MEITSCDPLVSTDIDTMLEALNEFKIVPQDYLYIIFSYGLLEFGTKPAGDGVRYNLMHPIDSYEFYFDTISGPLIIPGMYPFASGLGAANLYYGEIDGRLGVYSCINSPVSHEGMVFIANKFTDILRYGEGCEILKELGS
ncbi:hypothetical protein [Deinococcus sp. Leaf326]|uniref:hypothetical protein n=1 Tax=Deinococcus sp. Leaf326 TaxID=1736338 RepID=UPI0012E11038|nr:hypothetical protein [Deinococcus sp. Leaf326]